MKNTSLDKEFIKLQKELSERILHFASFIDASFGDGRGKIGNELLESIETRKIDSYSSEPENVNLSKYRIGRALPFFYEYAYKARCIEGIDWSDWNIDNIDTTFREFLEVTDSFAVVSATGNDPDWGTLKTIEKDIWRKSLLWEMIELCDARHSLDFDDNLLISDIVILSKMNEKSVKNALKLEGDNQLKSEDGIWIKKEEALRWLQERKGGFRETTFVSLDKEMQPQSLKLMELSPFIESRLTKLFENSELSWLEESSKALGYKTEQVINIINDINTIPLSDCTRIAKLISVDPVWFTEQVFSALFPEQMEMILFKTGIEYSSISEQKDHPHIEVYLSEKGIKNGYIDIPSKYSKFFPQDTYGDRSKDKQGKPIELRFGTEVRHTDIRVKSSITLSPRARFSSYLNKVVKAKPGDKIQFIRIDERVYEIKYISLN